MSAYTPTMTHQVFISVQNRCYKENKTILNVQHTFPQVLWVYCQITKSRRKLQNCYTVSTFLHMYIPSMHKGVQKTPKAYRYQSQLLFAVHIHYVAMQVLYAITIETVSIFFVHSELLQISAY
jgi:hypothetical protein